MKPRFLCAIVVALALPALGQSEPQLEPLVPNDAPWLQKNQKKRKKALPKQAPAEQAQKPPAEPPLTLPPLAPLTPSASSATVGVLVQGALPGGAAGSVEQGLRAVARRAPGVAETSTLQAPEPCADVACWVTAGVARQVDRVLVAAWENGALRVRLVDVKARRQISEAQQGGVAAEPTLVTASAEALACKLLVPAGCTGEVVVDAAAGIEMEVDGQPLARGEKRTLPVGVHALRVREGKSESSRALPVLIEGAPPVFIATSRVAPAPAPAAAVTAMPEPAPRRTWTRTAGYAAAGAAVVAAAAGTYFGLKSKSDIDSAESAYRANGNAWQPGDLDTLNSGNSKAHTANALFIASGVLLAAGAALTFAF
jgi:hypothetical protein